MCPCVPECNLYSSLIAYAARACGTGAILAHWRPCGLSIASPFQTVAAYHYRHTGSLTLPPMERQIVISQYMAVFRVLSGTIERAEERSRERLFERSCERLCVRIYERSRERLCERLYMNVS